MKRRHINWTLLAIGFLVIIAVILLFLRGFNGGEDNWTKDSKGVWVRHGNPSSIPADVVKQLAVISCANVLYEEFLENGTVFNSQCLGNCSDYSIDIVHVPRNENDDLSSNQCSDYSSGVTKHFVELDPRGMIVRIV